MQTRNSIYHSSIHKQLNWDGRDFRNFDKRTSLLKWDSSASDVKVQFSSVAFFFTANIVWKSFILETKLSKSPSWQSIWNFWLVSKMSFPLETSQIQLQPGVICFSWAEVRYCGWRGWHALKRTNFPVFSKSVESSGTRWAIHSICYIVDFFVTNLNTKKESRFRWSKISEIFVLKRANKWHTRDLQMRQKILLFRPKTWTSITVNKKTQLINI